MLFDLIREYIDNNRAVIFSSATFPSGEELSEQEKSIFDFGIETGLKAPCSEVAEGYIKTKVAEDKAEDIIKNGLPEFASFNAIDDFLESVDKEAVVAEPAVVSSEPEEKEPREEERPVEEEVVPLGLTGETTVPEQTKDEAIVEVSDQVVTLGLPGEEIPESDKVSAEDIDDRPSEVPDEDIATAETEGESDIVALGLPGEKTDERAQDELVDEIEQPEEPAGGPGAVTEEPGKPKADLEEKKEEEISSEPVQGEPLKDIKEERFIIKEIPGELVEDNF